MESLMALRQKVIIIAHYVQYFIIGQTANYSSEAKHLNLLQYIMLKSIIPKPGLKEDS